MEELHVVGSACEECLQKGLNHKLRYFYINMEDQLLKCESRYCLWPHNDLVSSDDEDVEDNGYVSQQSTRDETEDEFIKNLLEQLDKHNVPATVCSESVPIPNTQQNHIAPVAITTEIPKTESNDKPEVLSTASSNKADNGLPSEGKPTTSSDPIQSPKANSFQLKLKKASTFNSKPLQLDSQPVQVEVQPIPVAVPTPSTSNVAAFLTAIGNPPRKTRKTPKSTTRKRKADTKKAENTQNDIQTIT